MATYLKRTSKMFDLTLSQAPSEMNLRDFMCPVCRGILIEPVTLPCTHNLCLRCLKGTFEHNSLSCPLCRIRVGSWLRTASKSESLVNNHLWEYIRSKFPKEIEGKNIDDVPVIHSQDAYVPKLLSAPGEIRREYELQLQKAAEEIRKQRENERIANEQFIRKIHDEEEKNKLAQLAQDQFLARSLAKKQLIDKEKTMKFYNDYLKNSNQTTSKETKIMLNKRLLPSTTTFVDTKTETQNSSHENIVFFKDNVSINLRKPNLNIINKLQPDRLAVGIKPSILNRSQQSKTCCDHSVPLQGLIAVKNHNQSTVMISKGIFNSFSLHSEQPCCSSNSSKIYGQRSEEELRVPSDVLANNKKSVEVVQVMTNNCDDKRIESPQSAGSHDSINSEIHHFKPIRALPRTPLKVTHDGRQIDTKIIRVMPVLKRISCPILKAPISGSMKRIIGCTWSAFRGKQQQAQQQQQQQQLLQDTSKHLKRELTIKSSENNPQTSATHLNVDLTTIDLPFDTNKNYTRNINRLVNGTKLSKKTVSYDTEIETSTATAATTIAKSNKSLAQVKNGALNSSRSCRSRKKNNTREVDDDREETFMNFPSTTAAAACSKELPEKILDDDDDDVVIVDVDDDVDELNALENFSYATKRRKLNVDKKNLANEKVQSRNKKASSKKSKRKDVDANVKRQKIVEFDETEDCVASKKISKQMKKRLTRNSMKSNSQAGDKMDKDNVDVDNHDVDKRVIHEQDRMERILLQEKQDFELAQRLQAEFNEMERISGRTRGSRRALERSGVAVSVEKSNVNGRISATQVITSKRRRRHCD